jgi:hypothetical protein
MQAKAAEFSGYAEIPLLFFLEIIVSKQFVLIQLF